MHKDEIFEVEDIFLNNNNNNIIPSGEYIDSRPPAPGGNDDMSLTEAWQYVDKKLIIATLVLIFLLGFIFAKIISK